MAESDLPMRELEAKQAEPVLAAPGMAGLAPVAPLWHTLLLVAAVLAVSILGMRVKAHLALASHHLREYWLTLAWEWLLACGVLWGLMLRRTPLRVLLGEWPQGLKAWLNDIAAGLVFWVISSLVLAGVASLLRLVHLGMPEQTIAALAPRNAVELVLFFALSLSAGFCEELLFRGYFQQQFAWLAQGRIWIGVAVSALLFGCAHLYEGIAGVISIAIFGVMFSLLALRRRSLRPGMVAHAWHDALSGLALFVLQHFYKLS